MLGIVTLSLAHIVTMLMGSAIGRLRLFLNKVDPSFSIINKNGTYQLIIPEKPPVK